MASGKIPSTARAAIEFMDRVVLAEIDDAFEKATEIKVEALKLAKKNDQFEPDVRKIKINSKNPEIGECDFLVIEKEFVHIHGFLWLLWGKKFADELYYGHFIANNSQDDQFSTLGLYIHCLDAIVELSPEEIKILDDFYDDGFEFINRQCGYMFIETDMQKEIHGYLDEVEGIVHSAMEKFKPQEKDEIRLIFRRLCYQEVDALFANLDADLKRKQGKRQRTD